MILFNNYDMEAYEEEAKEFYKEENEARERCGDPLIEYSDEDIYTMADEYCNMDYENTLAELTSFFTKKKASSLIAAGSIGRWDGARIGFSTYKNDETGFKKMLDECMEDCDCCKIESHDDGTLTLDCTHHDGTNHFEILLASNKAIEEIDEWDEERSEESVSGSELLMNLLNKKLIKKPSFI